MQARTSGSKQEQERASNAKQEPAKASKRRKDQATTSPSKQQFKQAKACKRSKASKRIKQNEDITRNSDGMGGKTEIRAMIQQIWESPQEQATGRDNKKNKHEDKGEKHLENRAQQVPNHGLAPLRFARSHENENFGSISNASGSILDSLREQATTNNDSKTEHGE